MTTIHLMCGFIGFGKTTIAKELEKKINAVRFTHDDIMVERYGRNMPPEDFQINYKKVDDYIRAETAKYIQSGRDVILDYGFWNHARREEYYTWAKTLTDNVIFHVVYCDIDTAKKRMLVRSENDKDSLLIRADEFEFFLKQYEPWDEKDNYPVILYNVPTYQYIGKTVAITMDRPLGCAHPKHGFIYPVNYGFVPYTISGDGEELDAYVLGVDAPMEKFIGKCIAVVHRTNDNDDKLVVVPNDIHLNDDEIEEKITFQEKWFKHILVRQPQITKTHFGVYGVIICDKKILLIKKARGPYTGLYDLPGGSQEQGEDYLTTLKREIMEETGCIVLTADNERQKSIIFSDFTVQSSETGVLQHNAVLYDVTVSGTPRVSGDGLDSNGAIWVDIDDLSNQNATPYALIAAGKII